MNARKRFLQACVLVAVVALVASWAAAQEPFKYQRPPKAVLNVLDAPGTPNISVSPTRDAALLIEQIRYPSIADLAQPMLRLAGARVNPANNAPHNPPRASTLTLKRIAGGAATKIAVPAGGFLSAPEWSPDGKHFAFTRTTHTSVELWVGDTATATARQIPGVALNSAFGNPMDWMPDSRTLLCRTVPAGRGKPPERAAVPAGPHVEESYGRAAPVPTFQDLLEDTHDEDLFDYYATSQAALVDAASGKSTPLGKPAIFATLEAAPDGQHFLVARTHRPYSFILTAQAFPKDVEVWDRAGRAVYKLASLPLADNTPLGGVPTGPRAYQWRPTDPATLVWAEALDDGNPRKRVPHRDRVLWLKAPFTDQPAELAKTEHRFINLAWGEKGDFAILRELDRTRQWTRVWFFNPAQPAETMRVVWDQSAQERYKNPGQPVRRMLPTGHSAVLQDGDFIFLEGPGASPEGDRPFLDRFNTKTLQAERLWQCGEGVYESVVALLAGDASKWLTRRESPTEPPNYFLRTKEDSSPGTKAIPSGQAFTSFPNVTPQLRGIQKQLVRYKRPDGVDLSFTLYLPPDYKPGERRPALVWAYPLEFADADVAGQVSGSTNRFTTIGGISHLFLLLSGYVVLDNTTMPVIGDPETVNNTYVEQITASAKAAIDKAAEMGVIDPNRVGVGGHSYGAFMTANLLAHSDLFRAGIARSGAYNRTLTPFGFQNERRTLWQARDSYLKMSPFMYANQINEPILLIHGEADNNSGTFPIQSERLYRAVKGNGGAVRYVTLPHEAHGYAARESVEHTLWEMLNWMDRHVKNAGPRQDLAGGTPEARK